MKGLVADSNANNMDKALEALVAYLEKADEAQASRCLAVGCAGALVVSEGRETWEIEHICLLPLAY